MMGLNYIRKLRNLLIYIKNKSLIIFAILIMIVLVNYFIINYHEQIYVYKDFHSTSNQFTYRSEISSSDNLNSMISIDENWKVNPHSGTSIRCIFRSDGKNSGGIYFLNSSLNDNKKLIMPSLGDIPSSGLDLGRAYKLTFWARGDIGGEIIEFFCAGLGRNSITEEAEKPYPDSSPKISIGNVKLTAQWHEYFLDLKGKQLNYVLCGFGWIANSKYNKNNIIFYIDHISYFLQRERNSNTRFLGISDKDN